MLTSSPHYPSISLLPIGRLWDHVGWFPNVWVSARKRPSPGTALSCSVAGVPLAPVMGGAQAALETPPRGPAPDGLHPDRAGTGCRLFLPQP